MAKINADLEQQLKQMQNQTVDLIVRTAGDASPYLDWLTSAGLEVKHHYRLSPGVAVSGSGRDALKLLTQNWVMSVELDRPVRTMGN